MINPKDIRISQIENLQAIFFYSIDEFYIGKDGQYIGLKITYGDNQVLNYDYTSDVWNSFISRVVKVYNEEKDKGDITLLGDFTKEIMNVINLESFKSENNDDNSQPDPISLTGSRDFQIQIIKDYLKDVAKMVLSLFESEDSIELIDIMGYRDKYIVKYKIGKEENFFPMLIMRTTEDHFNFQIGMVEETNLLIKGDIDIGDDYVNVIWQDPRSALVGKSIYNIEGNVCEKVILYKGEPIYCEDTNPKITSENKDQIDFYLKLAGLETIDKVFKTVEHNYIMTESHYEDTDHGNRVLRQKSCHIKFDPNYVHLIYKDSTGLSKDKYMLLVPFCEEAQEIIFIPFTIEDKQYMLMQRAWIQRDVTHGSYKEKLVNKYYYSVFEISPKLDSVNGFDTLESFKFDTLSTFKITEDVSMMDEVISYIMRRDKK